MYVPHFNTLDDEVEIRAMVAAAGSSELITTGADGYPRATLLPVIWEGDRVIAHLARANPHWREIGEDSPALLVCAGPQAYISPSWYAAKADHGRVVPTWNYSSVHLTGRVRVHDDPEWVRSMVTALTDLHEAGRSAPWAVTDAPADFIEKNLRAIVGVEITVERVEGKAKLSQNRSVEDRRGVVAGLAGEAGTDAEQMAAAMSVRLND